MKKQIGVVLLFLIACAALPAQQDFPSIKNFLRVNEKICTGGQPAMDDLARLKSEGVKAVVNLRRPAEYNAEEEAAKAKELGLRYFNIPVSVAELKPEQADEFLKVMSDPANRPVFLHCSTANRVAAFWMIYRVLKDGWKLEAAEEEANKIGLRSQALRDFAVDYIRTHEKKSEKK
jgi:uncharacterized protein (TIGR01244 family)